jgi:hypothetical protein
MMKILDPVKSKLIKKQTIITLAGIITGAIGGYMYYLFAGCRTGTCPLTSNPWLTILWGAALGYLVFDMFKKKKSVLIQEKDKPAQN